MHYLAHPQLLDHAKREVIAKLRSFRFTAWTHRRGSRDDAELAPGEWIEPDAWLELRGAQLLPADPNWWDGETEEPNWDSGGYLADPRTGRAIPGTNMAGRPMQFLIDAWQSGRRTLDGVIICTETKKK